MTDRIMTLHPQGKAGVNIDRDKYDRVKNAILKNLRRKKEMTFTELAARVNSDLSDKFEGKIPWYVVTVKLDLEARHRIERVGGKSPQVLRIKRAINITANRK